MLPSSWHRSAITFRLLFYGYTDAPKDPGLINSQRRSQSGELQERRQRCKGWGLGSSGLPAGQKVASQHARPRESHGKL